MKRYFILVFIFIAVHCSYGQSLLTKDTVEKLLETSPAFSIYKDNYFIAGTTLEEKPTKYNSDAKFQVSFKQRLTNKPGWFGFFPYLSYSQKSFWDIFINSKPFAESNYNPSLFVAKPLYKNGYFKGVFGLGLEHESNGLEEMDSRSWNFISGSYSRVFNSKISAALKLWLPFVSDDNADLIDYIGYGQASASWVIKDNKLIVDAAARKGATWDWKGSLELSVAYRPFKARNQYIMLQWFQGYAESLIEYQHQQSMLRLGLVLKPVFYRFY